MADHTVVYVPEGTKVSVRGTRYRVTEETPVPASSIEAVPGKPQTNRWLAVACTDPVCVEAERQKGFKPYTVRGAKATFVRALPSCPLCGENLQPQGWSF